MIYPSQEDVIYLAGIVDGEGSIHIGRTRPSGRKITDSHWLRLGITNTSAPLAHWIEARFGGTALWCHRSSGRPYWEWACYSERAAALLRRLRPYLIIKQWRAWLALEYQAQRTSYRGGGRITPPEELALREGFRLAMIEINHTGEAA